MDVERRTYRWVASRLLERVQGRQIPDGTFLPTERELQEEFQVSRTTVRRALSWLAEHGHGEMVPNKGLLARRNTPHSSKTIAFIDGSLVVLKSLYRTLSASLMREGYQLIHVDTQTLGLDVALSYASERHCAGAFVWSFEGYPNAERLQEVSKSMPIVVLDHTLRGFESDVITFDYCEMARSSTGVMAAAGRKRIAISGMIDMLDVTQERIAGYMRGLFENGLAADPKDFVFCLTSGKSVCDTTLLRARLLDKDRPDAVFVTQDEFTPPVVQCILECGLRVPEDVAVATIGEEVSLSVGANALTTNAFDWNDFSQKAHDLMLERLSQPNGAKKRKVAGHELKVRGTCGTPSDAADSQGYALDLVTTRGHSRHHSPP